MSEPEKDLDDLSPPQTTSERFRDNLFTTLDHPVFFYFGIFVLALVVIDGAFFFFLMVGWHGMCTPAMKCDPRNWWLNWSIQVLCGLFTYTSIISMPWRVANYLHSSGFSCPHRSNEDGLDLYGRPTDDIWFHLPKKDRVVISLVLMFNCIFQYVNQVTRFIYPDYDSTERMPGKLMTLLFFLLSMVFAAVGAYLIYRAEEKVRAANPGKFPPSVVEILLAKLKGKPLKEEVSTHESDDVEAIEKEDEVGEIALEVQPSSPSNDKKPRNIKASVVCRSELRMFGM